MKNAGKRLFALVLCLVTVLGMFPVTAFAEERSEVPLYMATEDGAVYAGMINTAQSEVETAAAKTKLGKPTGLKWNKAADWRNGEESLFTQYGSVAFTQVKPYNSDYRSYRICLYRNGKQVHETYWGTNVFEKYMYVDLAAEYEFTSGTYYFTVQAIAQYGDENYANSAVAKSGTWKYTKPSSKMAKPTGLKWKWPVSTWNAEPGTKYMSEWYYSATKDGEPYWLHRSWGCLDGTDQPPKFEPGDKLEPGYYYFRVRTLSDNITKKYHSNWTELVGPYYYDGVDSLKAPTLKSSNVAASGKIKLTWNAVEGAAKYQVWRSTKEGSGYKRIATTSKLSYTDTGAKAGTKYFYKIRAVSPSGNVKSKYSKIIGRVCDLPRPEITVKLNDANNPRISWAKVEGAVKYEVYRATSMNGTYSKIATTKNLYQVNKNAVAGKTYFYKVKAVHSNTNANSAFSTVVSIKDK